MGKIMKNYVFSAKNNAFYPIVLRSDYEKAGTWPEDGTEVEDNVFEQFSGLAPKGMSRIAGNNGLPLWQNRSPSTPEQKIEIARNQKSLLINTAISFINDKQWGGKYSLGRLSEYEIRKYKLWLDYLDKLEEMDFQEGIPDIWPEKPE